MKRSCLVLAGFLLAAVPLLSQQAASQAVVPAPESLVVDGVPPIPASLAETASRYGSYRAANMVDWHPTKQSMLVSTRFAETPQLHLVSAPGAARLGRFHPNSGDYVVFQKDTGGGEWYQLYRYDTATGDVTMLTDGKSRNLLGPWSTKGDHVAYMYTRRTGKDTDLWIMNPADPKSDHLLTQLNGGGWDPVDWSPDDSKILLIEELSINETYVWLVDTKTGEKSAFTARDAKEKVAYTNARFSKDGKGIYVTTDKESEFQRLAYIDFATKQHRYFTTDIP
jgi:Tol biopolymer transport system component